MIQYSVLLISNYKKLITNCLLLIAVCVSLFSCYSPRYVYSPAAHNVPVFTKKGDSKLAANYSFNLSENTIKDSVPVKAKAHGYDLQAAYAITKHWAVQLNYFQRTERNTGDFDTGIRDSVVINYKRNLAEIGGGYFHLLKNRQSLFQVFAGIGFGKSSFTDDGKDPNRVYRNRYHQMNVTKVFIQPAFTVMSKKNFATTFSSRLSAVYFTNINTNYTAAELDNYKLDGLNYSPRIFWEPAIVNTFGFKKLPGLKLEFQLGFAFLVSRRFVDARAFNLSGGLLFDLPKLFAFTQHSSKN
ncbi:hypothetical protein [Ferruginibacter sp. SUN106]|uniref:hypothetical protein n=1 Tax=Ferruginibacter sp. SUN106 TaxID=2978348 RepID=UPI003D3619F7